MNEDLYMRNRKIYRGLMHSVDWFPTILEMADLKTPIQSLDGVSHYESMKSDKSYPRDEVKISLRIIIRLSLI